jgi:hypothetical protein
MCLSCTANVYTKTHDGEIRGGSQNRNLISFIPRIFIDVDFKRPKKGAVKPSNRRPNNTPVAKPVPFQPHPICDLISPQCRSLIIKMKYILTGTSGFIGSEILTHCLSNPLITSLLILSQRPLPDIESCDPRIKVLVLDNFLSYPASIKSELSGVKAVLW